MTETSIKPKKAESNIIEKAKERVAVARKIMRAVENHGGLLSDADLGAILREIADDIDSVDLDTLSHRDAGCH